VVFIKKEGMQLIGVVGCVVKICAIKWHLITKYTIQVMLLHWTVWYGLFEIVPMSFKLDHRDGCQYFSYQIHENCIS
jgi:hypothetical protein